ncbi:MAG: pilus assembly protein PilM [Sedimentisphaerales bacterium]|nr:pilus assembly protein PilM [Sedimentisphaerales bacterium]
MFGFCRDKTRPIGLDIGFNAIRMIQVAQNEEGLYIRAADQMRFDPDLGGEASGRRAFAVSAIREMLARSDFHRREVVTCLPNDSLKIKSLRLDTVEPEQIEKFMREEVVHHFGLHYETDEIRYLIAGNAHHGDEIKNEVIFFGADHQTIRQHILMAEEAGLTPVSLDAVPCALFRSFETSHRRQEDQHLVSVFVDVGSLYTTVIIGRGQEVTFIKQIPLAGRQLDKDVSERLGIGLSEAGVLRSKLRHAEQNDVDPTTRQAVIDAMSHTIEELAKEVSLCFRYYAVTFRGERPEEMVFSGREAYEVTLLNALRRHLGVEIRIAQPLRGFDLSRVNLGDGEQEEQSEWAVAIGLSMKGYEPAPVGR